MQGNKSKLQSFFNPPALHAPPAWKGLEHGEKEWHSFGASCAAAAATIPILRGILVAFLFNGHALAIYYLRGVVVVFRPECDVYMCCCPPLTSSQEKREWETSNSPRGMEEKSACMGCSCWPFAIITLIKVESGAWSGSLVSFSLWRQSWIVCDMLTLESGDAVVCCFLEQDLCGWGFQDQIHCSCANMVGFIVHLYFICMHLLCFKKKSQNTKSYMHLGGLPQALVQERFSWRIFRV